MRHPRRLTTCSLVAIAALCTAFAAPAPAKKVQKTCDALTGKTVLETPQVKIVQRRVRDVPRRVRRGVSKGGFIGRSFYGCALPAGKVHTLGSTGTTWLYERRRRGKVRRAGLYGGSETTFSSPAGTFVLVESGDSIAGGPSAGTYVSGSVRDLATGSRYTFWSFENSVEPGEYLTTAPTKVILSDQGVLAAVFDDELTGERSVRGFGTSGTQTVLDTVPGERRDDIPPDSLALDGTTVSWTNAGEPRSGQAAP